MERKTKFQRFLDVRSACDPARYWLDRRKLTTLPAAYDAAVRLARRRSDAPQRDWIAWLVDEINYHMRNNQQEEPPAALRRLYFRDDNLFTPAARNAVVRAFRLVRV